MIEQPKTQREADVQLLSNMLDDLLGNDFELNDLCEGCQYLNEWDEHHPYGSTTAAEHLAECTAPGWKACPRIEYALQHSTSGD